MRKPETMELPLVPMLLRGNLESSMRSHGGPWEQGE